MTPSWVERHLSSDYHCYWIKCHVIIIPNKFPVGLLGKCVPTVLTRSVS